MNEQQRELERAVIGRGKYQLQQQYKFLELPENKWFRMSLQQRKDHLSKLQSITIIDINGMGELESATSAATSYETIPSKCSMSDLSVDVENAAAQVNIPLPIYFKEYGLKLGHFFLQMEQLLQLLDSLQKQGWFSAIVERYLTW